MNQPTNTGHNKAEIGWDAFNKSFAVTELPWFTEEIDQDFRDFIEKHGAGRGKVLDVGTGPGTIAVFLAKSGYRVTATDISPYIIEVAQKRAGQYASKIEWRVDDVTQSLLNETYEIIHDRGCFHVLNEALRIKYVRQIDRLLVPGGVLCIKAFSKLEETLRPGAYKFDVHELFDHFKSSFEVIEWKNSSLLSVLENDPHAIFVVLKKLI